MSAVMQTAPSSLNTYRRKGGEIVHDERAHERIDKIDDKIDSHTELLIKMEASMKTTCDTLTSLSTKLKPITFTITATGYFQKAVIWISPIIVVAAAIWKLYDEFLYNHVG